MRVRIGKLAVVVGLFLIASSAGFSQTWQYEIQSDTWWIHDYWHGTTGSLCSCWPRSTETGQFFARCEEFDRGIPDIREIQVRITAAVLDGEWRSWLPDSEAIDEEVASALDLAASLETYTAVWLQVFAVGDPLVDGDPLPLQYRDDCGGWDIAEWEEGTIVFEYGALLLADPSEHEIAGSFVLWLADHGCDNWLDKGVSRIGRIRFRCWRELE